MSTVLARAAKPHAFHYSLCNFQGRNRPLQVLLNKQLQSHEATSSCSSLMMKAQLQFRRTDGAVITLHL